MVEGIVFDIQRFSLNDGPGIRTTVFLKGCPLRCIWCHNPESMSMQPQQTAGDNARMIGKQMSVADVMQVLERDAAYYAKSGGGITLSGGEPMFQLPVTKALLTAAKQRGWHTCLDTSGFASPAAYDAVIDLVDLFLFDIKAHDTHLHKNLTGQENERILNNLDRLYRSGAAITLRCPLIPKINDSPAHLAFISQLAHHYPGLHGIELMPYHNMASEKWHAIDLPFALADKPSADKSTQNHWLTELRRLGVESVRMG